MHLTVQSSGDLRRKEDDLRMGIRMWHQDHAQGACLQICTLPWIFVNVLLFRGDIIMFLC